jgi:VCBS repeat-containing protein
MKKIISFFIGVLFLSALTELLPAAAINDADIGLTLKARTGYQQKIDNIYWQHRIWPKENAQPKPSFDQVISTGQIRKKVEDYLKKTSALKQFWNIAVSGERLQSELDRISRTTKNPKLLKQLFTALNNDPEIICETLIRPLVVDQLIRQSYSFDTKLHSSIREKALIGLEKYRTIENLRLSMGEYSQIEFTRDSLSKDEWDQVLKDLHSSFPAAQRTSEIPIQTISELQEDENSFYVLSLVSKTERSMIVDSIRWKKVPFDIWWKKVEDQLAFHQPESFTYKMPEISGSDCTDDTWSPTIVNPPAKRLGHIAVWTGSEMIIWGGWNGNYSLNSGGRYDPATDTWVPTSLANAPTLTNPKGVWSGSELIAWDGINQTGGRYNPATNTWIAIDNTGAPPNASANTVVWSGTEMITFGWAGQTNVGGKYNPSTNSWTPVSNVNAASARFNHSAIWTGTEMVIWGGTGCVDPPDCNLSFDRLNSGGRYNPVSDTWVATNTVGAPIGRDFHSGIWTGSKMIIWGGETNTGTTDTGGIYDPITDQWLATNIVGAPIARSQHSAIWAGSEMIVWGATSDYSGGKYNPTTDSWMPTNLNDAPTVFIGHSAVWTGSEMIVWGGNGCLVPTCENTGLVKTGSRYNPSTDSWTPTNSSGSPTERLSHTAVWTGTEMIIWGGEETSSIPYSDTGSRYDPALDSWISISTVNVPQGRYDHTAIWTGTEMVVWGGFAGNSLDSGGRYNPTTDTWLATASSNAPSVRTNHTAIWTGSEMIVWGGSLATTVPTIGGKYNPSSDSWQPTSNVNVPFGRIYHTAVWTGNEMIVWGGFNFTQNYLGDGGRYDPASDQWSPTSLSNAPDARRLHTAVWDGNNMIVWGGGDSSNEFATGGQYNPAADSWTDMNTVGAPSPRINQTAVWAGNRMIIWGGTDGNYLQTGGRYDPVNDSWFATSTLNAPEGRNGHSAIWTGSQMIVWGGVSSVPYATGGLYCSALGAAPVAVDDQYITDEDNVLNISAPGVLLNDSGSNLSAVLESNPSHGSLQLNSDGSFTYTPQSNFNGTDNFTYHATDGTQNSNTAVVTITIQPINDSPDAIDDVATTPSGVMATIDVLINDSDPEGDSLIIVSVTQGANGTVTTDGSVVTYTPNPGFSGTDTFTYSISDGSGGIDTANVDITVFSCAFQDDFEDGIVDLTKWTIHKQLWEEISGDFVGVPIKRKAFALAEGYAGCDNCTIETTINTTGGFQSRSWILGWYKDKLNNIELVIKEDSDKWVLRQRVNGIIFSKQKFTQTIDPNVPYLIQLKLDGFTVHLSVNNVQIIALTVGNFPFGTTGYQVKNTSSRFGYVCVQ